jgi:poly-beta-1,6-N-acetyl-D-glucosamine synthase
MMIIFGITTLIILLYLLYPLWLTIIASAKPLTEKETEEIKCVSVILLSYNGNRYLRDKIKFLISELCFFESYELIIIDDNSQDGSIELLKNISDNDKIKVIINARQEGIPFSMNLGIANAKYEYVIFCDQRQELSPNILKRIVEPLSYSDVGAVSGCISAFDKTNKCSFIRKHENFLKLKESKAGSLIGVYGPFYSIKKHCYSIIPENIILDDLYLSLRVLKTKQIIILEDCKIFDDDFSTLYDFKRTRKYLSGFLQLLNERSVFSELSKKQKTMLLWHKYLRLLIPFFIFLCYITCGIMIIKGIEYLILFSMLTFIGLFSVLPFKGEFLCKTKNVIRLNVFYFIALMDAFINKLLFKNQVSKNRKGDLIHFG